jgi:hypothetical protein
MPSMAGNLEFNRLKSSFSKVSALACSEMDVVNSMRIIQIRSLSQRSFALCLCKSVHVPPHMQRKGCKSEFMDQLAVLAVILLLSHRLCFLAGCTCARVLQWV